MTASWPSLVQKAVFSCLIVLEVGLTYGQDFPSRPVRIIAAGPGGGSDIMARMLAQGMSATLGQIVVENRPSGFIPSEVVAKSSPDGYTVLFTTSGLWIAPLLQKVPYDPKDFEPVSLVLTAPSVLVVTASLPVKSVKELIAFAKTKPGELNYSSGGTGGVSHLAPELFMAVTGTKFVRVPFKSSVEEVASLIRGDVHLTFGASGAWMPQVKAGKLRALAVASLQPSELVPGLPTISATVPGFEAGSIFGLLVPAKTPGPIIRRLNQEAVRFLNTKDAKERFLEAGYETVGSTPEQLAAVIASDVAKWNKVIKDANIKVE